MGKSKPKKSQRSDPPASVFQTILRSLDPSEPPSRRNVATSTTSAITLLTVLLLLLLLAFLKRPFHIDDPLFIWVARHIQSHPANPYGFSIAFHLIRYSSTFVAVTTSTPESMIVAAGGLPDLMSASSRTDSLPQPKYFWPSST